jgi:dihydroorotase
MGLKSIEAVCATSEFIGQKRIVFDEHSGLITEIGLPTGRADFLYGNECLLFAGMGDVHIHAREDATGQHCYKEDFKSVSMAALNGGVLHVCDMPNNPKPPIDDQSYLEKLVLAEKGSVPIIPYAGIGPETRPLTERVPYKAYMGPSIGELFFRNNRELEESISHYRGLDVSFHCEDPEVLEAHKNESTHYTRRPINAELLATSEALRLIEKFNLKGKLCHYSAGAGLDLIRAARGRGAFVECEVTPTHLYFAHEELSEKQAQYLQMNPPVREVSDRELLLEALIKGELDYLATDHAPHTKEEKQKGISGLPGLDTFGPFCTWLLINKKIDPKIIARVTSENPGRFVGRFLPALKRLRPKHWERFGMGTGLLEVGHCANLTVLNLSKPIEITSKVLKTKAGHSPFEGVIFPGSVEAAFAFGKHIDAMRL